MPAAVIVLFWLLAQPGVHCVVPGPRNPEQLTEILKVLSWISQLNLPDRSTVSQQDWRQKIRDVLGANVYDHLDGGIHH